jgi:hypothetical protein
MGANAAPTLAGGRANVLVGSAVSSGAQTMNATVVGRGASTSANNTVVLGLGASATADGAMAVGSGVTATVADSVQIGPPAVSGTATMKFGQQIVCDEAWVGGGSTTMTINNNGDIVRSTPVSFTAMTTDATPTSMTSWMISVNTARRIQALITGRRTGGTAGATNDSGVYRLEAAVKNNGGVISISAIKEVEQEDQAGWNVAVAEPGIPDGSVHIYVTGAVNNNVSWEAKIRTFIV